MTAKKRGVGGRKTEYESPHDELAQAKLDARFKAWTDTEKGLAGMPDPISCVMAGCRRSYTGPDRWIKLCRHLDVARTMTEADCKYLGRCMVLYGLKHPDVDQMIRRRSFGTGWD